MKSPPQPKPTKYAGVQFKSKLEATWAVFLDYHPLVKDWRYEPRKFHLKKQGWDYTPDFQFSIHDWTAYIEVKPAEPTNEYLHVLRTFSCEIPHPLLLCAGDFFKSNIPHVRQIPNWPKGLTKQKIDKGHDLPDSNWFLATTSHSAIDAAKAYRFDLAERRPSFRSGSQADLEKSIQYNKRQQRKQNYKQQARKRRGSKK